MKTTTLIFFLISNIIVLECTVLPDYLSKPCSKFTEGYENCWAETLRAWGPYLLKGVKEINFPKLNPLYIPIFMVNRTLNDFISIDAVLRDFKVAGFDSTSLVNFKFDPHTYVGHMHLHIIQLLASMDYDIKGNIFTLNVESAGKFRGIAADIELIFDFKLKPVDNLGITYFEFDYFKGNSTIGNAIVKLVSKDPDFQPAADLIANAVNNNPRQMIDAVQPIYAESVTYVYRKLAEEILRVIPANEIVPE